MFSLLSVIFFWFSVLLFSESLIFLTSLMWTVYKGVVTLNMNSWVLARLSSHQERSYREHTAVTPDLQSLTLLQGRHAQHILTGSQVNWFPDGFIYLVEMIKDDFHITMVTSRVYFFNKINQKYITLYIYTLHLRHICSTFAVRHILNMNYCWVLTAYSKQRTLNTRLCLCLFCKKIKINLDMNFVCNSTACKLGLTSNKEFHSVKVWVLSIDNETIQPKQNLGGPTSAPLCC